MMWRQPRSLYLAFSRKPLRKLMREVCRLGSATFTTLGLHLPSPIRCFPLYLHHLLGASPRSLHSSRDRSARSPPRGLRALFIFARCQDHCDRFIEWAPDDACVSPLLVEHKLNPVIFSKGKSFEESITSESPPRLPSVTPLRLVECLARAKESREKLKSTRSIAKSPHNLPPWTSQGSWIASNSQDTQLDGAISTIESPTAYISQQHRTAALAIPGPVSPTSGGSSPSGAGAVTPKSANTGLSDESRSGVWRSVTIRSCDFCGQVFDTRGARK